MAVLSVQSMDKFDRGIDPNVTFTAATAADEYRNSGREILLMRASGAAVVTVTSRPDPYGRSVNRVFTFGGAGDAVFGPAIPVQNWNAADGNIDIAVDTPANMTYAVVKLPDPL